VFLALLSRRLLVVGLVGAGTVLATACSKRVTSVVCQSTVTGATSPASGTLTLMGQFYPDESVILGYDVNGQHRTAIGTPSTQRTALTLFGLPSGLREFSILISCNNGQQDDGSQFFTVM
jgi:hypothetical protein